MRKVAGFLALGLLGGLLGTQLPGATDSYQLKVIGLPSVAQEALAASGARITHEGSVAIVEGRSKKAAFKALAQAHVEVQLMYDQAWQSLEAIEDGELEEEELNLQLKLQCTQDAAERQAMQERLTELTETSVERQLENAELGLSVIEQAMQQLDPAVITP